MTPTAQMPLFNVSNTSYRRTLLDDLRTIEDWTTSSYAPFPNEHLCKFVQANAGPARAYTTKPLPENLIAGKNTYVYDAHTYHTKVPPQAIASLIEHYTDPGDIVLDPFSGSGMTGVAALQTGRKPILVDLSPAATFIAMNFLTPVDVRSFNDAIREVMQLVEEEERQLYNTHCRMCGTLVPMEYMVWSYGLICRYCEKEFVLWDVARDEKPTVKESRIKTEFDCPHCGQHLAKRTLQRTQLYPVQIGYHCCGAGRAESKATPDAFDLRKIATIESSGVSPDLWYPTAELPIGVNTRQAIAHGFRTVDALYTVRNLQAMARLWDIARRWPSQELSAKIAFVCTSLYQRVTRLSEFRFWGGSGNMANYNVPMIFNEQNVFKVFARKARTIEDYLVTWNHKPTTPFCISTESATALPCISDDSVDYVFTDPPFGGNINYSEMNFLWESWLGIFTDVTQEAIINPIQSKGISEYRDLMTRALGEIHRVLKPDRWLTVVFRDSSASVWSAIQDALSVAGFTVETTQTLDKQHGTFKQFVSENAVGYDLMLHCKKKHLTRTPSHPVVKAATDRSVVRNFVLATLKQAPEDFVVRYMHVKRASELDTRKLYSLWLRQSTQAGIAVDIDYQEFRTLAISIARSKLTHFWEEKED